MPRSDDSGDDAWIVYLEVADAAATQEAARANGGDVVTSGDLADHVYELVDLGIGPCITG